MIRTGAGLQMIVREMRSKFAFEDTLELTTPIKLRDGSQGYISGLLERPSLRPGRRAPQRQSPRCAFLTAAEFSVVRSATRRSRPRRLNRPSRKQ